MAGFGWGAPEQEPASRDAPLSPVPVLHVGEVHAELRLQLTEETALELGSQVASLIANAVRQGFTAGMAAAMRDAGEGV